LPELDAVLLNKRSLNLDAICCERTGENGAAIFPFGPFSPAWILLAFSAQVANFTTTWNLPPEREWWDEGRCQSYDKEQQDTAEGQKAPLGPFNAQDKVKQKT